QQTQGDGLKTPDELKKLQESSSFFSLKWILRSRRGSRESGRRSQHISPADEVRDHIAPLEVLLAGGSNAILPGFCGDKICPSQFVNVFGNFKTNGILIRSPHSIRVQVPFRHQSIRR